MNSVVTLVVLFLTCCALQSEAQDDKKAKMPPCCRDSIGTVACQRLRTRRGSWFTSRCNGKADFRLIQCCQSCEADGNAYKYDMIAYTLTQAACIDRMSTAYCAKFVNSLAPWTSETWNCQAPQSAVAFRICRLSCGYCSLNGTAITATVPETNYVMARAMEQCTGLGNNNANPLPPGLNDDLDADLYLDGIV
uniref:ShK domain-containing protein n=1 Tax=Plectus sambesii TaxID=2011161 RepID=A0A914WXX1_9BILA